jgi:hypothetical protein
MGGRWIWPESIGHVAKNERRNNSFSGHSLIPRWFSRKAATVDFILPLSYTRLNAFVNIIWRRKQRKCIGEEQRNQLRVIGKQQHS